MKVEWPQGSILRTWAEMAVYVRRFKRELGRMLISLGEEMVERSR